MYEQNRLWGLVVLHAQPLFCSCTQRGVLMVAYKIHPLQSWDEGYNNSSKYPHDFVRVAGLVPGVGFSPIECIVLYCIVLYCISHLLTRH